MWYKITCLAHLGAAVWMPILVMLRINWSYMSITAGRNPPESTEPKGLVMFLPGSISGVQVGGCAVTSCKRCIILVGNISQFWDVLSETSLIEGRADATDIIFTLHFSSFYIIYIYMYIYICMYIYIYVYVYIYIICIFIYIYMYKIRELLSSRAWVSAMPHGYP